MKLLRRIGVIWILEVTITYQPSCLCALALNGPNHHEDATYPIRMAFQTELSIRAFDFSFCRFDLDAKELVRVDYGFFFVENGRHVVGWYMRLVMERRVYVTAAASCRCQ